MLIKILTIFLGIVALATGSCMRMKMPTMTDDEVVVMCFNIKDMKAEMEKIPVDKVIKRMVIANSHIPKIETGTFEKFGTNLKKLEIYNCDVEEIEDHAFNGLTDLTSLTLKNNKIKEVKASWMDDMTSLTEINFNRNEMDTIDPTVKIDKLMKIDIGNNKFTCMDMTMMDGLKNLKSIKMGMNPLTWKCWVEFEDWSKNHPDVERDFSPSDHGFEKVLDVAKECLKTVEIVDKEKYSDEMDTCVEMKMNI